MPKTKAKPLPVLKTEKKNNFNLKIDFVLLILVILLLFLAGAIFYFLKTFPTKALKIQQLNSQMMANQISSQDKELILNDLKNSEAQRIKLEKVFPKEEELLDFIAYIDQIRNEKKVEVLDFSLDSNTPAKSSQKYDYLPMTLVLKGEQGLVDQQLVKLEQSPYFLKILKISKEFDPESSQVIVQVQFQLFVSSEFNKNK
ncbi:hypothetical protein GYA19_00815 [Candidatus Beckwithbacteria bacterium]|nr:hypothetical protein [Candidatus Beckwithbacteria bacterium]